MESACFAHKEVSSRIFTSQNKVFIAQIFELIIMFEIEKKIIIPY